MQSTMRWTVLVCGLGLSGCGDEGGSSNTAAGGGNLTSVSAEAAGDNCAEGGTRIDVGVDANGNGTLDADEITDTSYVCNAPGGLSLGDVKALLAISEEPAGDNCAEGGRKVESGIDRNGNGELDADEVDATDYDCSADAFARVHFGDFDVRTQADVDDLANYDIILGDLDIRTGIDVANLSLPSVRIVSGDVDIHNCDESGETLETITFPALERVSDDLDIYLDCGTANLKAVSAPLLTRVDSVYVGYASSLETLSLPALTHAHAVDVYDNPSLVTLDLSSLSSLRYAWFYDNESLSDCQAIETILLTWRTPGGDFEMNNDGVACEDDELLCPSLEALGAPAGFRGCYFAGEQTWDEARALCQSLGDYDLATFTSQADLDAFNQGRRLGGNFWVGYSDADDEGTWSWTQTSSFAPVNGDPAFWADGEPNGGTDENCLEVYSSGLGNDAHCDDGRIALCRAVD